MSTQLYINVFSSRGLNKDMSGRNVIAGTIDVLDFRGHYQIDGRVLILPIVGDGLARFTCSKLCMIPIQIKLNFFNFQKIYVLIIHSI